MILYQLAKRLEQRRQLTQTILTSSDNENNLEHLVSQKEQVEEQLLTQANRWSADGNDEFLLAGLGLDADRSIIDQTWN